MTRLLFFAQAAQWMGCREMLLVLAGPTTLSRLVRLEPQLRQLWEHRSAMQVAVNREVVDFEREVNHGDEIAFLPPYSGG